MKSTLMTFLLMSLPALADWEEVSPLPQPASGFVTGVVGDKIIVAGGTNWPDGTKHWLDTVWSYDPKTNVWSEGPPLPHPLAYAAHASSGDRLFFAGGADGKQARREIYSLNADLKVTQHGNLPKPLAFASAAILHGQMHIVGGTPDPDDWSRVLPQHLIITLRDAKSSKTSPLDQGLGLPAIAHAANRLFVFTGAFFDTQKQVHNLDIARSWSQSWQTLASYPVPARGVATVTLSDARLYLAGGYGSDAQGFLADAWLYDIPHNRYLPAVKLPIAATLALVRCGDHIYALGGEDQKKHRTAACFRIPITELLAMP